MGMLTPTMEKATVLTIVLVGMSAQLRAQDLPETECRTTRVSHVCTRDPGPIIVNICPVFFNVSDIQRCIRQGREGSQMTCYPCCQDPGKSIQECSRIESGSEAARWTFDYSAAPEINPCEVGQYDHQECIQRFKRASGPQIERVRNIRTWEECQSLCRQTAGCEWWTHKSRQNVCSMRRQQQRGGRRNLNPVAKTTGGADYVSGSVMSSALTSPNCECQGERNMYDNNNFNNNGNNYNNNDNNYNNNNNNNHGRRHNGNGWGWGSWDDPCPIGNRQTQRVFGVGIVQCCPQREGTDGTPVCEF